MPGLAPRGDTEHGERAALAALAAAVAALADGFALLDGSWRFTYLNPRATAFLGGTADLLGRLAWECLPEPLALRFRAGIERAAAGEAVAFDWFDAVDSRWLACRLAPCAPGYVFWTVDVTERRLVEEELRRGKLELERASRAKDQFLATLSHELRTPLAPVLAVVSSLEADHRLRAGLSGELAARLADKLALIRRNVELEARLIDDMLDLTRIARGRVEIHPRAIDLRPVVEHALAASRETDLSAYGVEFEGELAAEPQVVLGDPERLAQVFGNLLHNAAKFTPAGGKVTVRSLRQGERLLVEVEDSGIGIDPLELPRIFEPFEQGEQGALRESGGGLGLGLGLAISKAIVELHGGRLTARSEGRGRGATFTVDIPALPPAEAGSAPAVEVAGMGEIGDKGEIGDMGAIGDMGDLGDMGDPGKTPPGAEPRSRTLRILLVEDHVDTAEAIADLLRELGHEVRVAGGVQAGLAEARAAGERGGLDLVVSDLGLPDGSGYDLVRGLDGATPAIALSGYGMEEDLRQSREAGFLLHLTKPISLEALMAALDDVAGRAPARAVPR